MNYSSSHPQKRGKVYMPAKNYLLALSTLSLVTISVPALATSYYDPCLLIEPSSIPNLPTRFPITDSKYSQIQLLSDIAIRYSQTGREKLFSQTALEALDRAEKIIDTAERDTMLSSIALKLQRTENLQLALQAAKEIANSKKKDYALKAIAVTLAKTKRFSPALQIAENIQGDEEKAQVLYQIAIKLSESGRFNQALQVLKSIKDD